MEIPTEFSSAQPEEQPQPQSQPQTQPQAPQDVQPQKSSGLKKLGLVLLILCPILLVLFLPGYAIITYVLSNSADVSAITQSTVRIAFQLIGIFSIIGVPLGAILYIIGKRNEKK